MQAHRNHPSPSFQNMQAYGLQEEDWSASALTICVVGASGDLAKKKIFPALFALYTQNMLPEASAPRQAAAGDGSCASGPQCLWQ